LVLEGGAGALAKPEDQIGDGPAIIRREVAAWELAKGFGWPDLVATTILRDVEPPEGGSPVTSSLQVVWPFAEADIDPGFADEDVWRAAVFDAVIAQADRLGHNWLAVPATGQPPQLKLSDHGYCLDPSASPPMSTFYDQRVGDVIPDAVLEALRRLLRNLAGLSLQHLLPGDRRAGIGTRAQLLLTSGRLQLP
jgi:hypothetical protein